MINAANGGTLMDKTPIAARQLISNMATNTQQFRFKRAIKGVNEMAVGAATSVFTNASTNIVCGVDNQRLENKINELSTMVRHLVIGQQQQQVSATNVCPARVCGICASLEHPTDTCYTLQETNKCF
uniref:Uncharacterized protein n=1 Tax=Cajanus cajan TaxID=3821 RepID=A0A151SXP3_CAJCA|nr:hypothetical protein KK1_014996 [Cajanus cajan]